MLHPTLLWDIYISVIICFAVCRALGLPCKSVTCFGSAHDTDESTTIDTVYKIENGKRVKDESLSRDSIW